MVHDWWRVRARVGRVLPNGRYVSDEAQRIVNYCLKKGDSVLIDLRVGSMVNASVYECLEAWDGT